MKNLKIKIIVGFRRDQEHSVPAEEAHKAYFLFLHPEARSIFSNGLALKGDQIQEIVPDYQGSMGWNPSHTLGPDDYNELREEGVSAALQRLMGVAKDIARIAAPEDINLPLPELLETKYKQLTSPEVDRPGGGMKKLGDIKK